MNSFINDTTVLFVSIVLEALPFVLLGAFLSSLISVFISEERLMKLVPKNRILAFGTVSLLGLLFPVCDCTILPIMRRFISKGMPIALAVTFMCAVPIVNPAVFASTAWAFADRPEILWLRMGVGLAVAILSGIIAGKLIGTFNPIRSSSKKPELVHSCGCGHDHDLTPKPSFAVPLFSSFESISNPNVVASKPAHEEHSCGCGHDHSTPHKSRIHAILVHTSHEFYDSGSLIIVGALISALIQMAIPREILYPVASGPVTSVGAMMSLSWLMSLCANADSFVAKSFDNHDNQRGQTRLIPYS